MEIGVAIPFRRCKVDSVRRAVRASAGSASTHGISDTPAAGQGTSVNRPPVDQATQGAHGCARASALAPPLAATQAPARPRGGVVDVFCGAGGLSHGFLLEGFDVRAGIDIDASCRHAYESNNGARFIEKNVADVRGDEVRGLFTQGQPRILVGCAPCQPFSTYSRKRADDKWKLLGEFARLVREVQPDVLSMENVPRLANFHDGALLRSFLRNLEDAGYAVWSRVVDCAAYGVPQTRQRLVVLASRVGPIELVPPTHAPSSYRTVRDAIADLPPIAAGESAADDPLHRASRLSAVNLARIQAAKPGQTWRNWDPRLVAKCHRKRSGRWYQSVYGRMSWDAPAPTITTQCNGFGNGRFGHPQQDRAISLREAALLQTFPSDYQFFAPDERWFLSSAARCIGNAVPVALARAVARSVAQTLDRKCDD